MAKQNNARATPNASEVATTRKPRLSAADDENPSRDATSRAAQNKHSKTNNTAKPNAGELNRLIHERMRLGIVSALAVNKSLTFNDLKNLMQTTDGNLSIHARKLEEAGYISCTKSFDGRIPKTEYKLAAAGRLALEKYINHMEALIRMTREG